MTIRDLEDNASGTNNGNGTELLIVVDGMPMPISHVQLEGNRLLLIPPK